MFPSTPAAFGELPFCQVSVQKAASVPEEVTLRDCDHCLLEVYKIKTFTSKIFAKCNHSTVCSNN